MPTPRPNVDRLSNCRRGLRAPTPRKGLSLIEILLVVTILGIVAAAVIPSLEPSLTDQLENAAVIVVGDLEYARNLAVANNSKYQLSFASSQSYYLAHSGGNPLPSSAYRQPTDSPDRQTTIFSRLPGLRDVRIVGACLVNSSSRTKVTNVEFNKQGATAPDRMEVSEVWLAAGQRTAARYLPIRVNPVTGLAQVGAITGQAPAFSPNN